MKTLSCRKGLLRAAALTAAATVAMTGLVAPAHAAPVVDEETGNLTIHKYDKVAPAGDPGTGMVTDENNVPADAQPLDGIEFTAQRVQGIDLSTNDGWVQAASLAGAFEGANIRYADRAEDFFATATYDLDTSLAPAVTANGGVATFTDLAVGQYLITETNYPAGVTPSAPFLVTVPLTDPTNNDSWIYNVHVYPKNSNVGGPGGEDIDKTVTDAEDVQLGDTIDFTINAGIPNEEIIDGYKIVDHLDENLSYVNNTTVTLSNGTEITEGTHYTVQHVDGTVTVEFTADGLVVLADNYAAEVVVNIQTTVDVVGEIENEALVYPNAPSFEIDPGEPGGPTTTPPAVTKWGGLTLLKHGENDTSQGLAGAEFQVFTSAADARAQTNQVTLRGETTFSVDDEGQLTLSGLRYSDWANGATVAEGEEGYRSYWLVETKAPAGYELLAAPIKFEVTAETTDAGIDLNVENVPSNAGFELPMTGGNGTALLYGAGLLLVGGAVLMAVRSRRQAAAQSTGHGSDHA